MPLISEYPEATDADGATLLGVQEGDTKQFPASLLGGSASGLDLASYDGFTRTASGNIGQTETHPRTWTDTTNFQTTGGRLKKLGSGQAFQLIEVHSPFGVIETSVAAGISTENWVICHYVDTSNYVRVGVNHLNAYVMQRIVATAVGDFFSYTQVNTPPTPANGDVLRVHLWPSDGIDVYINDVHIFSAGEPEWMHSMYLGVSASSATPEWDYFSFTPAGGPSLANYQKQPATIVADTGTTYTPVLSDTGKIVTLSDGSATTLTLPLDATAPIQSGASITFIQLGAGQVTAVAEGGVTLRSAGPTNKFRAQYSVVTAIKLGANTWLICGDLAAT